MYCIRLKKQTALYRDMIENNIRKERLRQLINKAAADIGRTIIDNCVSTVVVKFLEKEAENEKERMIKLKNFLHIKNLAILRDYLLR